MGCLYYNKLFGLAMCGHFAVMLAVLHDLEALRSIFLVLGGLVIEILADRAFQVDKGFL